MARLSLCFFAVRSKLNGCMFGLATQDDVRQADLRSLRLQDSR